MKIFLATDAWHPQVNGVVRTLTTTIDHLQRMGHEVVVANPDMFFTVPCPTYGEIRLALGTRYVVEQSLLPFAPNAIHIATEGPIGMAARRLCLRNGLPFTTAYHTRFPEYLSSQIYLPSRITYSFLRRFHRPSQCVMVPTLSIEAELVHRGFTNVRQWTRGVDVELFKPRPKDLFKNLPRPIFLYVGRVSTEKNLPAFLDLQLPGSKVVVGDGPQAEQYRANYPSVHFMGVKHGEELARHYASADVFVFPSHTDTFGLVVLEALASGLPVAAFPVAGPIDVIGVEPVGVLHEDLQRAALAALKISPAACREFALQRSWQASVNQFLNNLHPFDWPWTAAA